MKKLSDRINIFTMLVMGIAVVLIAFSYYYLSCNNVVIKETGEQLLIKVHKAYEEKKYPTPNVDKDRVNEVIGVVLHHTAEPTVEKSLAILSSPAKKVGTHVVIDTDGTRYVMADPNVPTYHAGYSILNGREGCNYCTIGIEFQGNTLVSPLTNDQIESGIEYLLPIIDKYKISLDNIVTHEMVRNAYKKKYPHKRCSGKVDITQEEYLRFMRELINSKENTKANNRKE